MSTRSKLITLALLGLLAACGSGGGGDDDNGQSSPFKQPPGPAVTLTAGCDGPAASDAGIRVPEDIDTTQPFNTYFGDFPPVGEALRMWLNEIPRASGTGCPATNPITRYNLRLVIVRNATACPDKNSPDGLEDWPCAFWSGNPSVEVRCEVHAEPTHTDQQLGYAFWHCIDGDFN